MLAWAAAALTDPKRARGGVDARPRHRAVADHRARNAALSGGRRRLHRADVDPRRRAGAAARHLRRLARRRLRARLPGLRLRGEPARRSATRLSPVWLSAMVAAGAIAVALAWLTPASPWARLGVAALGGAALAAPSRWSGRTASAGWSRRRPSSTGSGCRRCARRCRSGGTARNTAALILTLPVAGLIGYALMLWQQPPRARPADRLGRARRARRALHRLALLADPRRPAAQLLSIPGATALLWAVAAWVMGFRTAARSASPCCSACC